MVRVLLHSIEAENRTHKNYHGSTEINQQEMSTPSMKLTRSLVSLCFLCACGFWALPGQAESTPGHIQVSAEDGLKVYLDNKFVGVTTDRGLMLRNVPIGPHVVRVERERYHPQNSDTFMLESDQVYLFEVGKMEALPEPDVDENEEMLKGTGSLVIQTIPVKCLVTLYGIGLTGKDEEIVKTEDRWTANGVRAGRYLATFSTPDVENVEHKEVISIRTNQTTHVMVDIERGEMTDIGLRTIREYQTAGWREKAEAERQAARQENMALLKARSAQNERREDFQKRGLELLLHQGEKQFDEEQYTRCLYTMLQALYLDPKNEIARYYYRQSHVRQGAQDRAIKLAGEYRQFVYGEDGEMGFELKNENGAWALRVFSGKKDLEVVDASVHDFTLKFSRRYTLSALQMFSRKKGSFLPKFHANKDSKYAYEDFELTLDGRDAEGRRRWRHARPKLNGVPTDEWFPVTFVKKGTDQPPQGRLGIFHEEVAQVAFIEGDLSEAAIRDRKGWPAEYGAVVLSCYKESPAQEAGLLQGDFIYKFDGADVLSSRDLERLIATNPFETIVLSVYRDGQRKQFRVKLEGV
jgi:hypothetical protein